MNKLLYLGIVGLALSGCGGGSDSSSGGESGQGGGNGGGNGNTKVELTGIYSGKTNQGQDALGLVDKNNKVWFLYTPPYQNGITGLISGDLSIAGNKVESKNGRDFYFGAATSYNTTLNGTFELKKSLNGNIVYSPSNQVSFNTSYDADLNKTPSSLQAIAGSYKGDSAILQGFESATLNISNTGVVNGLGESGCRFAGKISAEKDKPYYTLNLVFEQSPCYMAGKEMKGVGYFDASTKTLYAAAENKDRDNAVLYVGTKL